MVTIRHAARAKQRPLLKSLNGSPEAWDLAREGVPEWAVPDDPTAARTAAAADPTLAARAECIARLAPGPGVVSYGAGAGHLESAIVALAPHLDLTVTEHAPQTAARLARIFPKVVVHDLVNDPPIDADFHVLHRVDTEFNNATWRTILDRFETPVLMVVSETVTPKALLREAVAHCTANSHAGYIRTLPTLRRLFPRPVELLDVGGLHGLLMAH